jgi:hypothetical protein
MVNFRSLLERDALSRTRSSFISAINFMGLD